MKVLLLSFTLGLQSLATPDRWFSADKVEHFFIGTFVQSASFGALRAAGVNRQNSIIAASAASTAVAIGKELRDRGGRGDPSPRDAAWTMAGAAAISPILLRTP
jgi:uncharacterized protein YfiM (DUF2279 family)